MAAVIRRKRGELKQELIDYVSGNAAQKNWPSLTKVYDDAAEAVNEEKSRLYRFRADIEKAWKATNRLEPTPGSSNGHRGNGKAGKGSVVTKLVAKTEANTHRALTVTEEALNDTALTMAQRVIIKLEQQVKLLRTVLIATVQTEDRAEMLNKVVAAVAEFE